MLIQPPAEVNTAIMDVVPCPPIGLAYIASVLRKNDLNVRILDAFVEGWQQSGFSGEGIRRIGLSDSEIKDRIQAFGPEVVGISSIFTIQRKMAYNLAELCKKINPEIKVVFGGAHATALPEEVLSNKNVDFVVLGESEESFLELVLNLKDKKAISGIDGIGYHEDGAIKIKSKTRFLDNLDMLPFPAMDLLPMEKYFDAGITHGGILEKRRYLPLVTSRGCPANCVFCCTHKVWGKRYRYRSPKNIIDELKRSKEEFGIEEVVFTDDNLTLDKNRAKDIFQRMIDSKLNLSWVAPNGVAIWTLDEEMLRLMKDSGCLEVCFPVESGDQYVLDHIIKKPVNLSRVMKLIRYSKSIGLKVGMFLVVGLPGEKEEDIKRSFNFAKKSKVYPFISIANPYPGSELYDICDKNRYFVPGFSLDRLTYSSYNMQTDDWSATRLKDIVTKERAVLRLHYYFNNPTQVFGFLKRCILNQRRIYGKKNN